MASHARVPSLVSPSVLCWALWGPPPGYLTLVRVQTAYNPSRRDAWGRCWHLGVGLGPVSQAAAWLGTQRPEQAGDVGSDAGARRLVWAGGVGQSRKVVETG